MNDLKKRVKNQAEEINHLKAALNKAERDAEAKAEAILLEKLKEFLQDLIDDIERKD